MFGKSSKPIPVAPVATGNVAPKNTNMNTSTNIGVTPIMNQMSSAGSAPDDPVSHASEDQKIRSARVDTLIGRGTTIDGDLQFSGGLHIEGVVKGNLIAENDDATLILSEQGRIQGEVRVPSMVVNGSIDGDVFAHGKVELFEKARVCGDVYYNLLEMAVGAEVNGKLVRQKPEVAKQTAAARGNITAATVVPEAPQIAATVEDEGNKKNTDTTQ